MAQTYDNLYVINYTDINQGTISIPKNSIITNKVDIALVGQSTLDYGQEFDENILHLLENFASLEDPAPVIPGTIQPDLSQVTSPVLSQPTEGEFWFNKTQQKPYVWASTFWKSLKYRNEITGNSGVIAHGQQIPQPINDEGYVFSYDECSFIVSPMTFDGTINYAECFTDTVGTANCRYRLSGSTELVPGLAQYLIIGSKDSSNHGTPLPAPSVSLNPTLTPTLTPTRSPTPSVTPTLNVSATATPTVTPTVTPVVSFTPSVTPTLTRTITPTLTRTVTPTPSVNYITYLMTAGTYTNVFTTYGYNRTLAGALSPTTFNGSSIIEISSYHNLFANVYLFRFTIEGVFPQNMFSSITFVDNASILRTFTSVSAIFTNNVANTNWEWVVPANLFNVGVTYTIIIYP